MTVWGRGVRFWCVGRRCRVVRRICSTPCRRGAPGRVLGSWSISWSFPNGQQISQLWSGSYAQNGAAVTVANTPWNGTVPANGSVTFGFLASWTGTNAAPAAFTVNGAAC